jgi:hypothetical protein
MPKFRTVIICSDLHQQHKACNCLKKSASTLSRNGLRKVLLTCASQHAHVVAHSSQTTIAT